MRFNKGNRKLWLSTRRAFSLVELIAALAVIVLMLVLAAPSLVSLKGAGDFSKSVSDLARSLEQARAHAMANSTYVYAGLCNLPKNSGLVLAIVASREGTKGYDSNYPQQWSIRYDKGSRLIPLSKLATYNNIQLSESLPNTGGMTRSTPSPAYCMGSSACAALTNFSWPPGSALDAGTYSFEKVVQFDPRGAAQIPSANDDTIPLQIELDLTASNNRNQLNNYAAIQVNGMTGKIRIYRP